MIHKKIVGGVKKAARKGASSLAHKAIADFKAGGPSVGKIVSAARRANPVTGYVKTARALKGGQRRGRR